MKKTDQKPDVNRLLEELLEDGQPRPGDKAPDNAWRLQQYFRAYSLEAIERLAMIMRGQDEKLSMTASSIILDRGWGKAIQQVEVGAAGDFSQLSDTQLDEFIRETKAQLAQTSKTTAH